MMRVPTILKISALFLAFVLIAIGWIAWGPKRAENVERPLTVDSDFQPSNETTKRSFHSSNSSRKSGSSEGLERKESSSSAAADEDSQIAKDETANARSLEASDVERDRKRTESSSSETIDSAPNSKDTAIQTTEESREEMLLETYAAWESTDTIKYLGIFRGNKMQNDFQTVLDDGTVLKYYRVENGDLVRETEHPDGAVEKTLIEPQ